jgi:hypothetical protein
LLYFKQERIITVYDRIGGNMKKIFVSIFSALLLLVPLMGPTFATQAASQKNGAPAGSEKRLLFKGSLQEVENDVVDLPTIYLHGKGSGNATVLGQFTILFEGLVHNDTNGVGIGVVAAQYIDANGDILFLVALGVGSPTQTPGINSIVEKYTIKGGTGRFAGASGSFTVERMLNLATGVSSGTIEGKIRLP